MRRIIWGAVVAVLAVMAVWLGRPVARAELGVSAANTAANVCVAPKFASLIDRKPGEKGCTNPAGCANSERVSATFLPHVYASLAAYREEDRFTPENGDVNWRHIESPNNTWSGFSYDVYERTPASGPIELMVAFRGTDSLLGFFPYPNDFFAILSTITQFVNPWDQYKQARTAFAGIRDRAIARARGRPVTFTATGHSLGGGLAQHVAYGFPCVTAVVFNSTCVSNRFRYKDPASPQIISVEENRDWLTSVLCVPTRTLGYGTGLEEYEGNWVRDRVRNQDLASELGNALDQHDVQRMAAGMTRDILCCVQRERTSSDPGCACASTVSDRRETARRVFCEGRKPGTGGSWRQGIGTPGSGGGGGTGGGGGSGRGGGRGVCDFSPVPQKADPQCLHACNRPRAARAAG